MTDQEKLTAEIKQAIEATGKTVDSIEYTGALNGRTMFNITVDGIAGKYRRADSVIGKRWQLFRVRE